MKPKSSTSTVKVAFVNAHSSANRGDHAIVVAMAGAVRAAIGDCAINVVTPYADENRDAYREHGLHAIQAVWDGRDSIPKKYFKLLSARVFGHASFDLVSKSEVVCGCGGGYLYSSQRGPLGVGLLTTLEYLRVGGSSPGYAVLFPQSIGPFSNRFDEQLTRRVLRNLDLVAAREPLSSQWLEKHGVPHRLIPDVAFSLGSEIRLQKRLQRGKTNKDELTIGVTVLDWRFAQAGSSDEVEEYLERVAEAIRAISASREVKVRVFPQVTLGEQSDEVVSRRLVQKLGSLAELVELGHSHDPLDVVSEYSKCDLFIGSRMHSCIFAICGGTPVVALAYQPKTKGTFLMLGVEHLSLDIRRFTSEELKDAAERALSAGPVRIHDIDFTSLVRTPSG